MANQLGSVVDCQPDSYGNARVLCCIREVCNVQHTLRQLVISKRHTGGLLRGNDICEHDPPSTIVRQGEPTSTRSTPRAHVAEQCSKHKTSSSSTQTSGSGNAVVGCLLSLSAKILHYQASLLEYGNIIYKGRNVHYVMS